jgi:hypothetical protein
MGKTGIGRLGRAPSLEAEQIVQVYEAAGRSIDVAVLQKKSDEMFPEAGVKWYRIDKSFKGFIDENGVMRKAKYTIGTGPTWAGVMEDGSALPY